MTVSFDDLYEQKELLEQSGIKPIESLERLKISRGYYANFILAEYIVKNYNIPKIKKVLKVRI